MLGAGRAHITCQPLPRGRFRCRGFVAILAGVGCHCAWVLLAPCCCPTGVWWPLELFHGDSLGRGTAVGEAVPAHHPSVPWLSCAAPSCPSFLPGSGLKVHPNGQLRLLRAAPEDAGTYLCMARNPSGTAAGRTRLVVQGTAATRAPVLTPLLSPIPNTSQQNGLPSCEQVPSAPSSAPHHCCRPSGAGGAGGAGGAAALCRPWCPRAPRVLEPGGSPAAGWESHSPALGGAAAPGCPGEHWPQDVQVSSVSWGRWEVGVLRNPCLLLLRSIWLVVNISGRARAPCSPVPQAGGMG